MLTPEQKLEMIKFHFPSNISMWAVDGKFPAQSRLIDEAYAAGAKDMRERCAATADSGQYFIRQQASRIAGVSVYIPDIGAAIRALGTT